jgi:hypothetical protein
VDLQSLSQKPDEVSPFFAGLGPFMEASNVMLRLFTTVWLAAPRITV